MNNSEVDQVQLEKGRTDATRDIEAACPRLFWGTRGDWGNFFVELFCSRFGVKVEHADCFAWPGLHSYREGYNSTVIAHIDDKYGSGAYDKAREEVSRFRQDSYARQFPPRA